MSFISNNHQHSSSSSSESDETHHYQHGISGTPTDDDEVVLLKNSNNGAQIYLVGTIHIDKESAELVKKVIDYVRPDVVAEKDRNVYMQIEQCEGGAKGLMNWKPEDDTWYKMCRNSMRAPGGLCMKIDFFISYLWDRRMHADGVFPGLVFKVAIEESSRVGANCICIDQDSDVTDQQLSKVLSFFGLLWELFAALLSDTKWWTYIYTRASVRETSRTKKEQTPQIFKVMIEDRDKFMFKNLEACKEKL